MSAVRLFILLTVAFLGACGTYYDPSDNYVRGVRFYDRGDYVTAKELWQPMAEAGDCDAAFRMGTLYIEGRAVEVNLETAISWWRIAANQGQPRAQFSLGDMYGSREYGTNYWCSDDCEKDPATSYKWYLLAERFAGYDNDKRYIARLLSTTREHLTPAERAEGERLAKAWRPSPHACQTRVLL